MRIAGIAAEFNPFHNGHQYLVDSTRQNGATHLVAAMSGCFVQRGEAAMADKFLRADAAVRCGVDLVLDLPVPWALGGAASFARGAVFLLSAAGCDLLSFGCEAADKDCLVKTANLLCGSDVSTNAAQLMKQGLTYPSALQRALSDRGASDCASVLEEPNNVLAVEYIKYLISSESNMDLLPVRRFGSAHDAAVGVGAFRSGSALRSLADFSLAMPFMPREAYDTYAAHQDRHLDQNSYETAVLTSLRLLPDQAFDLYVDDRSGLSDRLKAAVKASSTLDELFRKAKTKSLTLSKVRRETMHLFLQIPPSLALETPSFIRVLACNEKGLEVLSKISAPVPLVTKHAETKQLSSKAKALYELQCRATDLYGLCTNKKRACCREQTSSVSIIRSARQ